MNLLAAPVDDAGLFPPGSRPMAVAVARHRADEAAGHPMLSNRFLCPASLRLRAYGSCSTSEPREEAAGLGRLSAL